MYERVFFFKYIYWEWTSTIRVQIFAELCVNCRNDRLHIGQISTDTAVQMFQTLQPEGNAALVVLYHWIVEGLQDVEYSFLCDGAQSTRHDTTHCHVTHVLCCNIADQFHYKRL